MQGVTLFLCQANVKQSSAHILTKLDHKVIEKIYENNDAARQRHVAMKEKEVRFCAEHDWNDVEVDEVDLGHVIEKEETALSVAAKRTLRNQTKKMKRKANKAKRDKVWEQWGGIIERGYQETLVLSRLNPIKTKRRAPGPGPISKRDWKPLGNKHLKGRKVILHSDGARTYELEIDGVIHDNVVHKKKQIMLKGKKVWVRPKYVKVVKHKLPGTRRTLLVKAGTQIIDRFWQHLRAHLKHIGRAPRNEAMTRRIRSAQWTYWVKGKDLWLETGKMCTELFKV